MEILSASDAKREFGEVLLKAQHGPVGINKNGKPVAVMVSAAEYAELDSLRAKLLQQEIDIGLEDIRAGRVKDGKDVMQRLRKKVRDAGL
ncbi:MAG: antitoxin [Gammaproteobacteria bacterium]|nr:MAG: antitoxin [Gammaproteobacteria bacterium]